MMNKEEFIQLLQDKKYKTAQNILSEMNDMDTAAFLEELDAKECALAFRLISKEKAANIFSCMSSKMQTYLVDMFSETELKELLDDLYMDDTVDMLEDLPANLVTRILKNLDSNKRSTINKLLKYPEDSAGSIMTTEYVTLKKTMTVKQAMNHIKDIGIHKETIYTCYVTENKRLMGIVTAKSLMTSDDDENITNLMNTNIISVHTHTDQEQVAHLFRKYDLIARCPYLIVMDALLVLLHLTMPWMLWLMKPTKIFLVWLPWNPMKKHILKLRFGNKQNTVSYGYLS